MEDRQSCLSGQARSPVLHEELRSGRGRVAERYNPLVRGRDAAILAAILALILAIAAWRLQGPEPGDFSHAAYDVLKTLIPDDKPHPVESPANELVRDRIIERFRAAGYSPQIERGRACNRRGRCANVQNIVVLPQEPGDIVLGTAHYDSHANGPGASDDGAGVVTMLECARRLQGQHFRNPIGFLITDGEEAGLLGAKVFVADHALSQNIRAVVNVENRGTSGPSFLFETSTNNRDLVPLFNHLPRPFTSSLFYTVYQLLPNDTDVTVFKGAGKVAVNFAAIGGVEHYHTMTDDLEHVNPRTLQHHGDNALAMLRALASSDLSSMRRGNAVFFDVLGFFVVWWPEQWTIWIALASLAILIVSMRGQTASQIAIGALMFLAAIVCAAILGIIAMKLMPHRLTHPWPAIASMWIAGIVCTLLLTRRRSWQGRALIWHAFAIALALTLPGVSYLFLVPAIATAAPLLRNWIAAPVAAILLFPLGLLLYTALGPLALPVVAVLMAIFASTITR
jgi:peptidase M28-like protein